MSKKYPITVKLSVHITNGENDGSATYVFGFGGLPSDEDMAEILPKVESAIPEGYRLMNRAEAAMHYLREEKGYRGPDMIIPRDGEWWDKDSDVDFVANGRFDEDFEDEE